MFFAELQAALLAAGYREERLPRRAGQRVFGAGASAALARQTGCLPCGYRGLRIYSFYLPSPFAVHLVSACPVCGCPHVTIRYAPPQSPMEKLNKLQLRIAAAFGSCEMPGTMLLTYAAEFSHVL